MKQLEHRGALLEDCSFSNTRFNTPKTIQAHVPPRSGDVVTLRRTSHRRAATQRAKNLRDDFRSVAERGQTPTTDLSVLAVASQIASYPHTRVHRPESKRGGLRQCSYARAPTPVLILNSA